VGKPQSLSRKRPNVGTSDVVHNRLFAVLNDFPRWCEKKTCVITAASVFKDLFLNLGSSWVVRLRLLLPLCRLFRADLTDNNALDRIIESEGRPDSASARMQDGRVASGVFGGL
jgi:hypothetical protein